MSACFLREFLPHMVFEYDLSCQTGEDIYMTELSGWNFHAYAGANRGCTGYASRRWAHLGPAAAQCGFTPPEEVLLSVY